VLFFYFLHQNHEKSQKSIKKHEKSLKSKLGVFLMAYSLYEFE